MWACDNWLLADQRNPNADRRDFLEFEQRPLAHEPALVPWRTVGHGCNELFHSRLLFGVKGSATQSQVVSVRIAERRHPAQPALADGGSWTFAPRRETLAFSLRRAFAVAGQPSQLPEIACFQQRAGNALERSHFADRFYLPLQARRHKTKALVDLPQDHLTHPVDRAFP